MDSKQRSEERRRIIEQRRLELLQSLGKGGVSMSTITTTATGPKTYAVLLFDGLPGEKNAPKQQVKGLTAVEAGQKALAWLEIADQYVGFPYLVIMGPPAETSAAAAKSPFPRASAGG